MPIQKIRAFFASSIAPGALLVVCTIIALLCTNSALKSAYDGFWHFDIFSHSLAHWINDGLMVIFFLFVGLELKREALQGALSKPSQIILPAVAAVGGMLFPALLFLWLNSADPETSRGWAIPCATDIAFSLGILALFGNKIPTALRVFLTALAIFDDLGAIIIIALFYSGKLSGVYLGTAAALFLLLILLNKRGVRSLTPYLLVGVGLWFFVLQSGVHATVAGVLLALTIPLRGGKEKNNSETPLMHLEHSLQPIVAFFILPVFALANAGVSLDGFSWESMSNPVTLGIILGLFFGKQIGVFLVSKILFVFNLAKLPEGANQLQFYGVALLTGIGFTMSLFIGNLAFPSGELLEEVKLGVLSGSLLSAVAGAIALALSGRVSKTT